MMHSTVLDETEGLPSYSLRGRLMVPDRRPTLRSPGLDPAPCSALPTWGVSDVEADSA